MKISHVAIALLVATCGAVSSKQLLASDPIPEVGRSTIGYERVHDAYEALKKKPTALFREENGWTVVTDEEPTKKTATLWSFTPSGHSAHPSVAKRTIYERDGAIWIDLDVHCEAPKAQCDQLVRDFQALNERAKQLMNGGRQ